MMTAPTTTRNPVATRASIGTSGSHAENATNTIAAVAPTITAHARALAANSCPSGTGTERRIQNARRSACMCVSGPIVAMYSDSEYARHATRPMLPVVQSQPAAPKICTPTKIAGIAISASNCGRSRAIRRRSLVAAVGGRAPAGGDTATSAHTAPASSQPCMPARRATAAASSIAHAATTASAASASTAAAGSPRASPASGAASNAAGDTSTAGASAARCPASAAGARSTQLASIHNDASDSAATSRSPVHNPRRRAGPT